MQNRKRLLVLTLILSLTLTIVFGSFSFTKKTSDSPALPSENLIVQSEGDVVSLVTGSFNTAAVDTFDEVYTVFDELSAAYGYTNAIEQLSYYQTLQVAYGKIYKFKQIYNDIPVFARGLNVAVDFEGNILSISGNFLKNLDADLNLKINYEQAFNILLNSYDNSEQMYIYSSELVIYSLEDTTPTLSYNIETNINGGSRVFVDAVNGEIITEISISQGAQVSSTQTDYYGQTLSLPLEHANNRYYLADYTRNIIMYDYTNYSTYNPPQYTGTTAVFEDSMAVSAYANLIKAFDFYADGEGIGVQLRGMDGSINEINNDYQQQNELYIRAYMHHNPEGKSWANASFTSFKQYGYRYGNIHIGDGGYYESAQNLALALDVIGHEWQHGIANYNAGTGAGLIYLNQSGAIDEAYADIFGSIIEGHDFTDNKFWLIGEDCTRPSQGSTIGPGIRSMSNPNTFWNPKSVGGTYFRNYCTLSHQHSNDCDYGGVHINSSIINHAFYQMYNNLPSFFTKQKLGILWYNTLCIIPSDSTFEQLHSLMRQTAINLSYPKEAIIAINKAFNTCNINGVATHSTITFDKGKLTGDAPVEILAKPGEDFVIPASNLTASNVTFFGWKEEGESTIYLEETPYEAPPYDMHLIPVLQYSMANGGEASVLEGDGSITNPYLIKTANDLKSLAYYVNNRYVLAQSLQNIQGGHVKLAANIDLEEKTWIPIGMQESPFMMNFDGGSYSVSGLKLNYTSSSVFGAQGLFGVINEGTVKNLIIENAVITSSADYVGGIVGLLINGSLENCISAVEITNNRGVGSSGAIAGKITNESEVASCVSIGTISGAGSVSGIAGTVETGSSVNSCADITKTIRLGELINDKTGFDFEDFATLLNPDNFLLTVEDACKVYRLINGFNVPSYTVRFVDIDGTEISSVAVLQSMAAIPPQNPAKSPDMQYSYAFNGWDKSFTNVYSDLTVTAKYNLTTQKYIVNFINGENVYEAFTINYGSTIDLPSTPPRPENLSSKYTFDGWYVDEDCKTKLKKTDTVTGNMDIYAKWVEKSDCSWGIITPVNLLPLSLMFIGLAVIVFTKKRKPLKAS